MLDDYIGDGVYVSWDGYHVVLDLRGQCRYAIRSDDHKSRQHPQPAAGVNNLHFQLADVFDFSNPVDHPGDLPHRRPHPRYLARTQLDFAKAHRAEMHRRVHEKGGNPRTVHETQSVARRRIL